MPRFDSVESVLEWLGLDPGAVQAQAAFYLAYARELEVARAQRQQLSSDQANASPWAQFITADQPWLGDAVLASSYRMAAQYLALIDARQAGLVSIRAALAYLRAGLPFGAMLAVGLVGDDSLIGTMAPSGLEAAIQSLASRARDHNPVQQTYLLLVLVARRRLRREHSDSVGALLRDLRPHGLHPIGSHSQPLADYLQMAEVMARHDGRQLALRAERGGSEAIGLMSGFVAAAGHRQAESLRAARRNSYLWRHGASPVDVVNLEDVAITGLLAGSDVMPPESGYNLLFDRIDGNDPLVSLAVWAAEQMSQALREDAARSTVADLLAGAPYFEGNADE
ncbi:MAG TPA: hypothetical protein VFX16_30375 [Pseudonocardiaceae bacterium]|nr:hypothetical protein [Pseudonocardiaceae bacterium]